MPDGDGGCPQPHQDAHDQDGPRRRPQQFTCDVGLSVRADRGCEPSRDDAPDKTCQGSDDWDQHRIGQLPAAGYADEIVARRMGVSVRTCRTHIARLMRTLGASSRTHLGALLAQSGIVGVGYRAASRGRADDK